MHSNPPKGTAKEPAHCSACEAVCCRLIVVLQAEDRVPQHFTAHTSEGLHVMAHGEDGYCVALNKTHMNCGIYEDRPSVCRRFVMNGPYCRAVREEFSTPDHAAAQHEQAMQALANKDSPNLQKTNSVQISSQRSESMPKINYSSEKRQREIAKKKKQESKQAKKTAGREESRHAQPAPENGAPTDQGTSERE